jgi:hypothetical protein
MKIDPRAKGVTRDGGRLGDPAVGLIQARETISYEQQIVKPAVVGTAGVYEWSGGCIDGCFAGDGGSNGYPSTLTGCR